MVEDAILCGTGLGKPHLRQRLGVVGIYHELKGIVGEETKVGLYSWKDYDRILRDLKRWRPNKVYCIGHSYGASTMNFVCKALLAFPNVRILHAIYCDPVWRPEIHRISKLSLDAGQKLTIPENVEKLSTIEQDRQPISGHDCITQPNTLYANREVVTDKRHAFLDRHPRFHELVMQALFGS